MITFPNSPLALLLAQASAPGAGLGMTQLVVQFGLIIAIIYFIMIRPQQRQRRKHEELLNALKKGDEIVLTTSIGSSRYRVTGYDIVKPTQTESIQDTPDAVLNLVTCYPFYYVGNAPKRFIVHAELVGPEIAGAGNSKGDAH